MINKLLLFASLFVLSACSSTNVPQTTQQSSATWVGFDENPEKTITGISDLYITDNSTLNIEVTKYELLNEVMTGFKDGARIVTPKLTGNKEWRSKIDLEEHRFRITGLGKAFETSASKINILKKLSASSDSNFIRVTCLTCSSRSEIDSHPQLYRLQVEPQMYQTNAVIAEEILKKSRQQKIEAARDAEQQKLKKDEMVANLNSLSEDEKICRNYGFKPGTNAYGECRQKLDFAKQDAAQRQRDYEEKKRQYDEQVAAIQKERDRQRGMKQLELGLRMMSGQPIQDAVRETAGMPPLPKPPGPVNQTIIMPGGRIVNCHTTGTVTNCF
jgi:hypothetical protein